MGDSKHESESIRAARPEDAPVLSALAMRSKAYWEYSEAFMAACRDELTYSPQKLTDDRFMFFVAESGQSIVGFHALEKLSPTRFELEALFVEPSHIGKGVGRALIEHAKTTARRSGATELVIQGDPHAERFYRAAGGTITGKRESGSIPGRYLPTFRIDLTLD